MYHGPEAAAAAEAAFDRVFKRHEVPEDVREVSLTASAGGAALAAPADGGVGPGHSNSDARRKIEEGAVRLDGEPVTDRGRGVRPGRPGGRSPAGWPARLRPDRRPPAGRPVDGLWAGPYDSRSALE